MAEAVGVAASIAGLITLVHSAVEAASDMYDYIQDVRHADTERHTFFEKFKLIESNLGNLHQRIVYIETQFGPRPNSRFNDEIIHGVKLCGGDRLFARSQAICEPGGEHEKLKQRLTRVLSQTKRIGNPKLKERVRRAMWTREKENLVKEQNEIIQLITCLRDVISDGDAEVNYDMHFQIRHIVREKAADQTIEILDWMCPPALSLREPPNPTPAVALNSSCHRFLDRNDTYRQWLNDASWQLNLYGRPGSGKARSVLAEAIAADLQRTLEPQGIPILSLFFRNKQRTRQTLDAVLCNLLRQILTTCHGTDLCEIPEEIKRLWFKSRSIAKRSLSEELARRLLRDQISRFSTKFLIIDAIDEAEGCMDEINREIKELRGLGVCILTTDRQDPRVNYNAAFCQECGIGPLELAWLCSRCIGHFGEKVWLCRECYVFKGKQCFDAHHVMSPPGRVNVEVSASQEDLQLLVTRFLDDNFGGGDTGGDDDMFSGNVPLLRALKQNIASEFWDSLPAKVSQAADGNFLYARLFLDRLRLQRNKAGVVSLTQQLDCGGLENLEGQYDAMLRLCLEKNDRYGVQVARNHLSIVVSSYEVLTFEQLSHAVAISPKDRVLDDFSGRFCSKETVRRDTNGLLTAQHSGTADSFPVSFFHRSLAVYMEKYQSEWFPEATQSILDACLSYLSLDVFSSPFNSRDELDNAIQEHPFGSYAACYWGFHACSAQWSVQNNLRILQFLNDQDRLECALQISWHARALEEARWDVPTGITPLHFCAFYGLKMQCQAILAFNTVDISKGEDSYNQTPLIYACRRGHVGVARLLLYAGANPNHLSNKGKSPLIEAIESFCMDMIVLLLSREDIDVNIRAPGRKGITALVRATELGQDSVVEKLLARADIDVNEPDGWGCTAMSRAVQSAKMGCVDLLLRCSSTDLTLTDNLGHRSPLDWTADESVVNSGITTDNIDSIADILLADRRRPKPSNEAISVAISQGRVGLLETFVKWNSLDLLYEDESGRNFLHLAASTGNLAVLKLIFTLFTGLHSFQVDWLDKHKATALHLACQHLSQEAQVATIAFLLDAGADPNLQDCDGLTAMARAKLACPDLWTSHVRQVFEARGVAIDATVVNLRPTLLSALLTENIAVIELELNSSSNPLDPEIDVYTGETLLWRVIELESPSNVSLLRLLLPRCTHFLSSRSNQERTCAHAAILKCSPDALGLLIDAGIDLDARDSWGMTALQLAQSFYRFEMCVQLIAKGAELPPAHEIRPGLLQAAVTRGDVGPLGRLLAVGIDTRHRDEVSGETALQSAERLLEDAERDVNDDLIRQWNPENLESLSKFTAEIAKAPEVVRCREVRDLVRDAQGPDLGLWGDRRRFGPREGLEKALVALKDMDPDRILTPTDWLSDKAEGKAETAPYDSVDRRIESASDTHSTAVPIKATAAYAERNKRTMGLLLAVILGWLIATATQLTLR